MKYVAYYHRWNWRGVCVAEMPANGKNIFENASQLWLEDKAIVGSPYGEDNYNDALEKGVAEVNAHTATA